MNKFICIIVSLSFYMGTLWAAAPIDFAQAQLMRPIRRSLDKPINLYQSTIGVDHGGKLFTARTILRLGPNATLSDYEQKMVRNEICASKKLYTGGAQPNIGSLGLYKHNQSIVSIADVGMAGKPLDAVLRELSDRPDTQKVFFAKYYVAAMAQLLGAMESQNIIWNNLELANFIVRPDGRLYAVDFSEATSVPATRAVDEQAQRNTFMTHVVRALYQMLFKNPTQAYTEYQALLTQARGSDAQLGADAEALRTQAWTLADIKAIITNSLGARAFNATPNVPFSGGIDAGLAVDDAAAVATAFDTHIANFLDRHNHKPWTHNEVITTIVTGEHQGTGASEQGNNNFGIDAAVRAFLIDPTTNAAYLNLNTLCNGWTGR